MTPVRVIIETESTSVERLVHARNRSRFALQGAVRSARRQYPNARSIEATFIEGAHHDQQREQVAPEDSRWPA